MNKTLVILLSFLLFNGCAVPQRPNTYNTQAYATLFITLDQKPQKHNPYTLYILSSQPQVLPLLHRSNKLLISPQTSDIQVVYKRQTATIKLKLEQGHTYALRVLRDNDGELILLQTQSKQ